MTWSLRKQSDTTLLLLDMLRVANFELDLPCS